MFNSRGLLKLCLTFPRARPTTQPATSWAEGPGFCYLFPVVLAAQADGDWESTVGQRFLLRTEVSSCPSAFRKNRLSACPRSASLLCSVKVLWNLMGIFQASPPGIFSSSGLKPVDTLPSSQHHYVRCGRNSFLPKVDDWEINTV